MAKFRVPGYKENAGIFCHNNPWIIIGETVNGNGNRAWEYYEKITPSYLEEISDLHKTEPYVYAQMIAGKDAFKPGEAKNSWLTGCAAWTFTSVANYILGIRPDYDGLVVDNKAQKGVKKMRVDGKEIAGNIIPIMPAGKEYQVEVILG